MWHLETPRFVRAGRDGSPCWFTQAMGEVSVKRRRGAAAAAAITAITAITAIVAFATGACGGAVDDGAAGGTSTSADLDAQARAAVFLASCVSPQAPTANPNQKLTALRAVRLGQSADYDARLVECLRDKSTGCQALLDCDAAVVPAVRGDEGPACDASFAPHCDHGRPVTCNNGHVLVQPECGAFDTTCEVGAPSDLPGSAKLTAMCVGTGAVCQGGVGTSDGVIVIGAQCEGDRLRACLNLRVGEVPCGSLGPGFTCQSAESPFGFCGVASECNPETTTPSCNGTKTLVCNAGRVEEVDCTSLGFTRCEAGVCR